MAGVTMLAGDTVYPADYDPLPQGALYMGERGSAKSTANDNTEVGVLRLDAMALKSGRVYRITASGLRVTGGGTTPHFLCTMRYTNSGTAGTGSTEIGRAEGSTATDSLPNIIALVQPSGDETGSVLLGFRRTAGTAAVTLAADTASSMLLVVEDLGTAVSDAGTDV